MTKENIKFLFPQGSNNNLWDFFYSFLATPMSGYFLTLHTF